MRKHILFSYRRFFFLLLNKKPSLNENGTAKYTFHIVAILLTQQTIFCKSKNSFIPPNLYIVYIFQVVVYLNYTQSSKSCQYPRFEFLSVKYNQIILYEYPCVFKEILLRCIGSIKQTIVFLIKFFLIELITCQELYQADRKSPTTIGA